MSKPTPLDGEDEKAKHMLLSLDMQSSYQNKLDVILHFLAEREAAITAARADENESIRHMLAETIELGRDYCYNHEKYVGQCYACQTAKWTKIIARMYMNSIKERLDHLNAKEKDV